MQFSLWLMYWVSLRPYWLFCNVNGDAAGGILEAKNECTLFNTEEFKDETVGGNNLRNTKST